jgi:alkylation response protein AidB-like acyl-CoA dehydrogenase
MEHASETDLREFRSMAERFAKKELEPRAVEIDNYPFRPFNSAALQAAQETGMLQVVLPEKYGGAGQGMAVLSEILMPLAAADASFAAVVLVNSLSLAALSRWGKKAVVESYAGPGLVAFPVYELPGDLPATVEAKKKGKGYVLDGKLEYLALVPVADALIVPARVEGSEQVALFVLERGATGVSPSEPVISLGLRNCPAADVTLEGVEVAEKNLLTAEGGSACAELAADFGAAAAAMAVGVVSGSYLAAKAYAAERYQGGRMIIDYDMVRQMLVNLQVVAESGKALVRAMAAAADAGNGFPLTSSGLILLGEQASRVTADGVQCLGGYGYMEEYGQEKRMRDAKQIQSLFGAAPAKRLELMEGILRRD